MQISRSNGLVRRRGDISMAQAYARGKNLLLAVIFFAFLGVSSVTRWILVGSAFTQSSSPLFAICICGQLRSLVRTDMKVQQRRAIYDPLSGAQVETFLNIGFDGVSKGERYGAMRELGTWYQPTSARYNKVPKLRVHDACLRGGYEQSYRWRDCLTDVQRYEQLRKKEFDFIVITRPDIEYAEVLPSVPKLMMTNHQVAFAGIVTFHNSTARYGRGEELSFVGDQLFVLPKRAFLNVGNLASLYESCIPDKPVGTSLCADEHWGWPECRLLNALMNYTVSRLGHFPSIVRCKGYGCSRTYRTACANKPYYQTCGSLEERPLALLQNLSQARVDPDLELIK